MELDELIKKIINYLVYITKNLDKVEDETECLLRVLDYLKEYKMYNPTKFLKVKVILI
jgi:hypothetical protein